MNNQTHLSSIAMDVLRHDIFVDVPKPSDALDYGAQGISLRARKPG